LAAFWSAVVDGELVQSSHERKYLALQLFQLLLPHLG
jgi:DNA polymerase phi